MKNEEEVAKLNFEPIKDKIYGSIWKFSNPGQRGSRNELAQNVDIAWEESWEGPIVCMYWTLCPNVKFAQLKKFDRERFKTIFMKDRQAS